MRVFRDVLAAAKTRLRGSASETPELDAELLLGHVLGVDRATLLSHDDRAVADTDLTAFQALVDRRARGEPVAYLAGQKEFFGLELAVDRRVLIPRPETETLVERALPHLPEGGARRIVADVGTGSGAIALAIATSRPAARVYATDTSAAALEVATHNVRRLLTVPDRINFAHGSLFAETEESFDVVCANLPYIPTGDLPSLPVSVRDYEPWTALDGGPDGLDPYRALLRDLPSHLAPRGVVLMECDPRQAHTLHDLARDAFPTAALTIAKDLAGDDRVVEIAT